MNNLTTATKTIENSFGTFEQRTWEIYGYQLIRTIKINAPEEPADWRIFTPKNAPTLDNMNYLASEGVNYGVSRSAVGTRSPREARAYAIQLIQASDVAEAFTKIRNDYSA